MSASASGDTPVNEAMSAERKRLYWHSRRGMWELDLLLIPFLDTQYEQLSPALQQDYQRLITLEDQDLFGWLMHREKASDPSLQPIIDLIVDHARNGSLDQYQGL